MGLKRLFGAFAAILLLSVTVTASMLIPAADVAKGTARAPEKSPVIDGSWGLERVDFIHYAKPPSASKPAANTCYKLLGVKWKTFPVSYAINPSNTSLTEDFITSAISTSAETWDSATSTELFNNTYTVNMSAQYRVQNFQNAIAFGPYPDSNVIAVTSVWYTPIGKQIVEFDMLLNTYHPWGNATADPRTMDLQNIATHELGHAAGLDDIYSTSCSAVTMYGYSWNGDTDKRTLEQPDIAGLQKMYGP